MFSTDLPVGEADVLLQTGCPDCIVEKMNDEVKMIVFYSKDNAVMN